jgi:pyruvate dehydrogenase E2 component (dihydrolipoamide acetyltransferase)
MPSLGADMDVGTVLEWRVGPGDVVHRGDIVAVVDTEKSDVDVEVFEDGTVEELLVEVGREVAVGTPLARIATSEPDARKTKADHVRASPLARRHAAEQGIDLATVAGSGPSGAVRAGDLEPALPSRPPAERADRHAAMRHAIGELMARSKHEIPHYYLATTIDLAATTAWLAERNAQRPVTERLLPAALLLKATALAAREVPALNGFWDAGFQPATAVHLGVAVSLRGGGLIAPAIHDADALSVDELMTSLRSLVERARAGRLRSSEMSDPTLTVTNLGDRGAEEVYGVVYPPQVAIVGFGRIVERPWAVDGLLGVRPTVRATLAADHRATDGHVGSHFLGILAELLQAPEAL